MTSNATTNTEPLGEDLSVRSSSLLKELTSLPLVHSLVSIYNRVRDSHWTLKSGLGLVEDTCSMVLEKVHIASPFAIRMDRNVGEGMTKLKTRYPSLTATPDEMMKSGQDNAAFMFHKTVRKIVRSYPGQLALKVFDWSVTKADRMLRQYNPPMESPRKRKMTRASTKTLQKEHAYASEDSGACETTEKDQVETTSVKTKGRKQESSDGFMNSMVKFVAIPPLEYTVFILKKTRRYLHAVSQKKRRAVAKPNMSPAKEAEIDARRKVSPRKKRPVSFFAQVKNSAYNLFGFKDITMKHIKIEEKESVSPSRDDAEKKRKHEDILTDYSTEESNDDDLADFDLDNYDSADDPDYEPEDSDVISEDISDAETESDIETETIGETKFVQLKEKEQMKQSSSQIPKQEPIEPEKKVEVNKIQPVLDDKNKVFIKDKTVPPISDGKNKAPAMDSKTMPPNTELPKNGSKMPEIKEDPKTESKAPLQVEKKGAWPDQKMPEQVKESQKKQDNNKTPSNGVNGTAI